MHGEADFAYIYCESCRKPENNFLNKNLIKARGDFLKL